MKTISLFESTGLDSKLSYKDAKIGEIVEVFNQTDFLVNGVDGTLLVRESEIKPLLGLILN